MDATNAHAAKFRPAARLAAIGVSETLKIGARATELKRGGCPVIVGGAGEPDFDAPEPVRAAAVRAIGAGETKYTVLDGTPALKAAMIRKFQRENDLDYAREKITAGAGAGQVIHNAFPATLESGDEVIFAAPCWTSYADMVAIAGGPPVPVACSEATGFRLDAADLERAITPRARRLLLNSPSNPTGNAHSGTALRPVLDVLLRQPQVCLLSDEIYEHLLYDVAEFASPARIEPRLKARTLAVSGVSKARAMTGWRLGYGAGPRTLIAAMAVVKSQSTTNSSSVSQAPAIAALDGDQGERVRRRSTFQDRRNLVVDALNAIDGVTCLRPEGAFYTFARWAGLIGRRAPDGTRIDSDAASRAYLLDRYDVAAFPGSCFGLVPYFRISRTASHKNLREACRQIAAGCEALT